MRRILATLFVLLVFAAPAFATCSGTTNGTPATAAYMVANDFQNGRAAGSITPDCIRDLIASGAGNATNVVNLKNLGLPTGGDDTSAINTALASVLPATFTGTGSIATSAGVSTLTITGSPGGTIANGQVVTGTNVVRGTTIDGLGTGTGGAGTYFLSIPSGTVSSETVTFHPPATQIVYAPCGIYKHAGLIVVTSAYLVGDGECSNFQATDTTASQPNEAIQLTGTNVALMNVATTSTWNSTRQSAGWSQAIDVINATNYLVQGVKVTGGAAGGIFQETSLNGRVLGDQIFDTLADAIGVYSSTGSVVIANNYVNDPGDDCFSIVDYTTDSPQISGVRYTGNQCVGGHARGFAVIGGTGTTIDGNIITNTLDACLLAQTDSGVGTFGPQDVVFNGNICDKTPNASGSGYQSGEALGASTYPVLNITFSNNIMRNVQQTCFGVGGLSNYAKNVTIIGNYCDMAGSTSGDGVDEQGVTNLSIINNTFYNVGNAGINHVATVSPVDAGLLKIQGNVFDKIATAGFGWAIYLPTSADMAFDTAIIRDNYLYKDGGTNAQGLITLGTTIPHAIVDGNLGDSVHNNSVSTVANGHYFDPYTTYTTFGVAPVTGGTKFTASGCSNSTTVGNASAGNLTLGAVSCTVVLTLNGATGVTAPNGWACVAQDQTHPTALISQSASNTTTASLSVPGSPAATSDIITFACTPY